MNTRTFLPRIQNWRYLVVYAVMGLVALIFVGRLFNLQILQYEDWKAQAVENYTKEISVAPPRGIIYDRRGYILARNVASYNIVVTPAYLPDDVADIQGIYRDLAALTGLPVSRGTVADAKLLDACADGPGIMQWVELGASNAPYTPVKIACNVDENIALIVRERSVDWPGVSVQIEPVRDYPTGSLTADVIGFLGPIPARVAEDYTDKGFLPGRDKVGYAGIEASMDDVLIGTPGTRVIQVDVAGKELRNLAPPVEALPGDNIVLTIDTRLQAAAEAALVTEIDSWTAYYGYERITSGVVIAMNPKTGEVLAMVSYPTYENNRLARIIPYYYYKQLSEDPRHPLLNAAITAEYPPGSTFKLSTATGALNEGVVSLTQIIQTPGEITLCERYSPTEPCTDANSRPFRDWIYERNGVINEAGFGQLDFLHCIAYSSNVCFYKLGGGYPGEIEEGLDIQRLKEYAIALGYNQPSGIELPGEGSGLIPDPTWKRRYRGENWSTGDTYIASVGQGYVLATPLQVLMSAATIANDGKLMQPTIIRGIQDSEGNPVTRWLNADYTITALSAGAGSRQISPFLPTAKWDITVDPVITDYQCSGGYCEATGLMKTVQPWVVQKVQEGMRLAVTDPLGTLNHDYSFQNYPIAVAGKTGTGEYCDDVALAANRCSFGNWPTHSWTVAYAPYEDPEIVILAFCYNGGEGGVVAAPVVKLVMDAYFELKAIDIASGTP
ncbi:MAG: penicillin-binding protein 2 [Anaerolineaceae bacterium]|nr:MAG: penicillin-binding protein 2 [Anaerolineaceae bacterium]